MNIKKAAEETGITAETIRYYERIGGHSSYWPN